MPVTDRFALEPVAPPTELKEGRARLRLDGRDTGVELPGQVLEGAVGVEDAWLLFVTHDVPYEEQLDIVLLDAGLRVQDTVSLGGMATTGLFRDLRAEGDGAAFSFIGGAPWRVRVLPRGRLRWPLALPVGVSRPFGFTTRLDLRRLSA